MGTKKQETVHVPHWTSEWDRPSAGQPATRELLVAELVTAQFSVTARVRVGDLRAWGRALGAVLAPGKPAWSPK